MSGGVYFAAVFRKPGRYVVRAEVSTDPCHEAVTGLGDEHVVITRTLTVTK